MLQFSSLLKVHILTCIFSVISDINTNDMQIPAHKFSGGLLLLWIQIKLWNYKIYVALKKKKKVVQI